MRDASINIADPPGSQHFGRTGQRAGRLRDVVDEKHVLTLDIADDVQGIDLGGVAAAFHDDGQTGPEGLGVGAGHLDPADIGRDDHEVLDLLGANVLDHHGKRVEVIDRNVEEALQLLGMQVHGEDAVDAGRHEDVGHELRRDRDAGLVLAVLAGIAEEGDHRGDAVGARAAHRIHHDEQFHDVLVAGGTGRLDDEDVAAAHVVVDLHEGLAVGEGGDCGVAERPAKIGGDFEGKLPVGRAAEDLDFRISVHEWGKATSTRRRGARRKRDGSAFSRGRPVQERPEAIPATTSSCSSRRRPGKIGNASASSAACSETGKSPLLWLR